MSTDERLDFVRQIVADDVATNRHGGRVLTRFPPEPNGYLHIGHAEAICLDFGVAAEYGGHTNLRMDDTNPTTEDPSYVAAIAEDIRWLGFEWEGEIRYASDYFEALYRLALRMVEDGLAYVDSHSEEEIRENRGTVTEPGRPGAYRDRPVEENLDLFRRMRAGEFEDGSHVLRARIDLAATNMKMRDPLMYRIRHAHHYRTGDEWPIYPMYDWAHGQSDAIEGITHSLCTIEFKNNRALYDWFLDHTRPAAAGLDEVPGAMGGGGSELGSWDPRPHQYEFGALNIGYTIVSKRRLKRLVEEGRVDGWDDPRMPTLAALRRRGVPRDAIAAFIDQVGIAKTDKRVDIETFEYAIRDALNHTAPRVMCVVDPLPVVIENLEEGSNEWLDAPYFPHDVESPPEGWPETRRVPFTRRLLIEREDFSLDPPKGFRRLAPGREVRLRHGFFITCTEAVADEEGRLVELRCTYDPATRGGSAPDGRRPAGTIHWVSADASLPAEVRLYDRLFTKADPGEGGADPLDSLNPESLAVCAGARVEPSVASDPPDTAYQFERQGYFVRDPAHESGGEGALVFNRTVTLRDTWGKRATGDDEDGGDGSGRGGRDDSGRGGSGGPDEDEAVVGVDTGFLEREARRGEVPQLAAAYERYRSRLGLPDDLADLLTGSEEEAAFFDAAAAASAHPLPVANWIVHEVRGVSPGDGTGALTPAALGTLVDLVESGGVSRRVAKDLLSRLVAEGGDPAEIVAREGLGRLDDRESLAAIVDDVLGRHADELERYRDGQTGLLGFFIGQVMRATDGRADAATVREVLGHKLTEERE